MVRKKFRTRNDMLAYMAKYVKDLCSVVYIAEKKNGFELVYATGRDA